MDFKRIYNGHTITDEHGVTYSEDGGILLHADPETFCCREYHIPLGVKIIWEQAFRNIKSLEKVVIDRHEDYSSLVFIGEFAFDGCEKLTEMDIPDSVCIMEQCIFRDCTSLRKIHMPSGIGSIPCECFIDCKSLEEVNIPEGVRNIEICAFFGCSSLSHIDLPKSLEGLEDTAFTNCGLRSVKLPGKVKFIGEDCFRGCPLDSLTIPKSVTEIIPWTVSWHPGFKGVVSRSEHFRVENDALISNGDDSILCCWSDEECYTVPESVKNLRGFANSHVSRLVCNHPIESISYDCFGGCDSLKEISLAAVNSIDSSAFYGAPISSLVIGGKRRKLPKQDIGK